MLTDQPGSEAVEFDGRVYSAGDTLPVLRDAAAGFVRSDDRQIAFDPTGWAAAFVRALRETPLWPALSAAMETLMLSDDDNEAQFAAQVARITGEMPYAITSRAIAKQSQFGRPVIVAELAWTMVSVSISDHDFAYDPALRDVLIRNPSALGLILVVSRFDAAWFVEHAAAIFLEDVNEAARQLAYARIGAVGNPQLTEHLRATLEARRPDLAGLW